MYVCEESNDLVHGWGEYTCHIKDKQDLTVSIVNGILCCNFTEEALILPVYHIRTPTHSPAKRTNH